MRVHHLSRAATLLAALSLASSASAQSLAEIAAQQKAKRKGKATKVFTEEDLRRGSPGSSTAGGTDAASEAELAAAAPAAPATEQPAQPSEDEQRAEQQKAWRDKLQQSRDTVTQLTAEVDRLQTALNDLTQPVYGTTRANRLAALDKTKQQLAAAQQSVVDLEEQGRRNGFR